MGWSVPKKPTEQYFLLLWLSLIYLVILWAYYTIIQDDTGETGDFELRNAQSAVIREEHDEDSSPLHKTRFQ